MKLQKTKYSIFKVAREKPKHSPLHENSNILFFSIAFHTSFTMG